MGDGGGMMVCDLGFSERETKTVDGSEWYVRWLAVTFRRWFGV